MPGVLTESQEQIIIFQWCNRNKNEYPELNFIFAIPNGGKRNIVTASRLKLEGVKPGVPDMFLPVARHNYHGLFIELKRLKGGAVSIHQESWKNNLRAQGYAVATAKGAVRAITIIAAYLGIKNYAI